MYRAARLGHLPLQVWALKSYTKSVPLYIQVLQRSSLALIAPFLDPEQDVIVSAEQTRHRLLALSCLCPGASTLIGERCMARWPQLLHLVLQLMCTAGINRNPCLQPGAASPCSCPDAHTLRLSQRAPGAKGRCIALPCRLPARPDQHGTLPMPGVLMAVNKPSLALPCWLQERAAQHCLTGRLPVKKPTPAVTSATHKRLLGRILVVSLNKCLLHGFFQARMGY